MPPDVSIVVACWNNDTGLYECLEGIEQALGGGDVEVILVANFEIGLGGRPSGLRLRTELTPSSALIPELWATGIECAQGRLVALTTAHFRPEPHFVQAVRQAHGNPSVIGVGGRINPPAALNPVQWAVYLLRYGRYLGLGAARPVEDFAADNGSYKTADLAERMHSKPRKGFWEHEYHREMRSDGLSLIYDPAISVRQIAAFSVREFLSQRFEHGRLFGLERAKRRSSLGRWLFAGRTLFLLPGLLLARTARSVLREPPCVKGFLVSLPILAIFATAWSAGEAAGYLARSPSPHGVR